MLTINKLIKILSGEGHKITYYKRKDGGIRIKSIDGRIFTGSSGNIQARQLLGYKLSANREVQLTANRQIIAKKPKKTALSNKTKNKIAYVQKVYREKAPDVGKITTSHYRYNLEHKGKKEADRLLNESLRYVRRVAYTENVKWLAERIVRQARNSEANSDEWTKIANWLIENNEKILEDDLQVAYEILGSPKVGEYAKMSEEEKIKTFKNLFKIE